MTLSHPYLEDCGAANSCISKDKEARRQLEMDRYKLDCEDDGEARPLQRDQCGLQCQPEAFEEDR